MSIESLVEEIAERKAREVATAAVERISRHQSDVDDETRKQIAQQQLVANKTWLSREELKTYLNISDRSILEYVQRQQGKNPLPERYIGSLPRYKRSEIDSWVERESGRRRLETVS